MARTARSDSSWGTASASANQSQLTDMIRKKAYELFEKRGKKTGHAMEDWLEAERIIKRKAF
ncbi:MAG: DUF2934 domain-containing protein [Candidatus Omnitrophota bacterium]|nr:DUF2934 domain-containing protein [Candidatus Omnitrophota bacterium]